MRRVPVRKNCQQPKHGLRKSFWDHCGGLYRQPVPRRPKKVGVELRTLSTRRVLPGGDCRERNRPSSCPLRVGTMSECSCGGMPFQRSMFRRQQPGTIRQVQGRSRPRESQRVVQRSLPRLSLWRLRPWVQSYRRGFIGKVRCVPRSSCQLGGGCRGIAVRSSRHFHLHPHDVE